MFPRARARAVMGGAKSYDQKILNRFQGAVISYLPLDDLTGVTARDASGNGRTGIYSGATLNSASGPDGKPCPYFDGTADGINWYTTSLRDAFNGAEGTFQVWARVDAVALVDGAAHELVELKVNASNMVTCYKRTNNNQYSYQYVAAGTTETITLTAQMDIGWCLWTLTWSKAGEIVSIYKNGDLMGSSSTLGVWAGLLAATTTVIGASTTAYSVCWKGYLSKALLLNRVATPAEILACWLAGYPSLSPGDFTALNAAAALTIPTYDSSNKPVHPSIVYAPAGWNGYKYWMAMTPYPASNNDYENPSIIVSNDGQTWSVPAGLTNPVIAQPAGSFYNSDPDLIFSVDGVTLWMVYVERDNATNASTVYVTSSTDGITWGASVSILTGAELDFTSPAILWDGAQFVMFYSDKSDGSLNKRTCATMDGAWSGETALTVTTALAVSHLDVIFDGSIYWALLHSDADNRLYFSRSDDAATFIKTNTALLSPAGGSAWDKDKIYRATFLRTDGRFDIWYSAFNGTNPQIGYTQAS